MCVYVYVCVPNLNLSSNPPSPSASPGKHATRLAGEVPEFDVFLSYRVDSDLGLVSTLYKLLIAGEWRAVLLIEFSVTLPLPSFLFLCPHSWFFHVIP